MASEQFCIECGARGEVFDNLCWSCYRDRNVLATVPEVIHLTLCGACGARLKGKSWHPQGNRPPEDEAVLESVTLHRDVSSSSLKVEILDPEELKSKVLVKGTVEIHGIRADVELDTELRIKMARCSVCSREAGNYFEAILQVRHSDDRGKRDMDRVRERVEDHVGNTRSRDRNVFISKTESVRGGLDFYLSSKSEGRSIAKELSLSYGVRFKESASLVGRRNGEDMYRNTFSVRLPPFRNWDLVSAEKGLFQIIRMDHNGWTVRDAISGERRTLSHRDTQSARVMCIKEDFVDAVVVSRGEGEVQLLHPSSFKTLSVKVAGDLDVDNESITVADVEGELIPVQPPDRG